MVVNIRAREISRDARKLIRTSMLIKNIYIYIYIYTHTHYNDTYMHDSSILIDVASNFMVPVCLIHACFIHPSLLWNMLQNRKY